MAGETVRERRGIVGGLLLWFALLGGALAWSVHDVAAWSIDELTCASGHRSIAGVPVKLAVALAVVIPLAVAVAALCVACWAWRRITRAAQEGDGERRLGRARLMAVVALGSDLLFVAIIIFGGAGLLVLPPCQH